MFFVSIAILISIILISVAFTSKFQKEISDMLYKIWYRVLLNGTSAGTLLSCISFCGMVATIAVEMGIPVDNITKSLDVSKIPR